MSSAKNHVSFVVTDFGDSPSAVTALMGIEATSAWRKGDSMPNNQQGKRTHDRWQITSTLPPSESIDRHLANLLTQLEARPAAVKATLARFEGGISIASYFYESNPGFNLPADLLARISALAISLDFDLYCLEEAG